MAHIGHIGNNYFRSVFLSHGQYFVHSITEKYRNCLNGKITGPDEDSRLPTVPGIYDSMSDCARSLVKASALCERALFDHV